MKRKILKNGLDVLICKKNDIKVASIQIWVKCGSIYEKDKEYGVSHFIEHLLFKGTEKYKLGEVAKEVEALGGEINAFTSKENTCYYITIPSEYVKKAIDILLDMVFKPTFLAKDIEDEREVILEEIKRYEDIPSSVVFENFMAKHFKNLAYERPILGFKETIENIKKEEIVKYYKRHYSLSNILLVLSGDIKDSIYDFLLGYKFSNKIKNKNHFNNKKTKKGTDIVIEKKEVKENYCCFGFHTPSLDHKDTPALDLLSIILGQGESSILHKSLRLDKSLVDYIETSNYTPVYVGTFVFSFLYNTEISLDKILYNIFKEMNDLFKNKDLDKEIVKAKNIVISQKVYGQETVDSIARKISYTAINLNNLNFEEEYIKKVNEVTKKDILNAMTSYINVENSTLSMVIPKKTELEKNKVLNTLKKLKILKTKEINTVKGNEKILSFNKNYKNNEKEIKKIKIGNSRLLTKFHDKLPITSLKIFLRGGSIAEGCSSQGISNFLSRTWNYGSKKYSASDLLNFFDKTATNLNFFSGNNLIGISIDVLSPYLEEVLDKVSDILINPTFEKEYFLSEKKAVLNEIHSQEDNLSSYCSFLFMKLLFEEHPYSYPLLGTKETIEKINIENIKNFHKNIISEKIITSVGNFDKEIIKNWVKSISDKKEIIRKKTNFKTCEQKKSRKLVYNKNSNQAHAILGFKTCDIKNSDFYILRVIYSILAGQSGRLFMNLRDNKSLAYSVAPLMMSGLDKGYFALYIASDNKKIKNSTEGLREELEKIKISDLKEEEIERAKNYILGKKKISLQAYSDQASDLAFNEFYETKEDLDIFTKKINDVKLEDIVDIAKKYFKEEKENLVVITNDKNV